MKSSGGITKAITKDQNIRDLMVGPFLLESVSNHLQHLATQKQPSPYNTLTNGQEPQHSSSVVATFDNSQFFLAFS